MEINPIFWLILLIIFIVFELITLGLTTIWFAGGALVAYILSVAGINEIIQIIILFVVSFALLIFTRPLAQKYVNKNATKTNIEAAVGKTAKVIERIDNINGTGKAVMDGEEWMARTENDDEVIEVGELVTVIEVKGVKIMVKKKENE